jgi:chaperone modulatory protein CbpM
MRIEAVLTEIAGLEPAEVMDWIARGWVRPGGAAPDWSFAEIDIARVRLVRDLRHDVGVEEENLDLVLSLLDQVYALRRGMRAMLEALQEQPEAVRRAVLVRLRE